MLRIKDAAGWFSAVSEDKPKLIAAAAKSFKGFRNDNQETALILAAKTNRPEIVEILAPHEAMLTDSDGHTALMWAAKNGNAKMIRSLIDAEREIFLPNNRDPLSLAAEAGNLETTNALTAFYRLTRCNAGLTPLDYAARANQQHIVKALIAEFDPETSMLESALRQAEVMGHVELASYLNGVITNKTTGNSLANLETNSYISRLGTPNTYSPMTSYVPPLARSGCIECQRLTAQIHKLEAELREERSKTHLDVSRILGKSYTDEDVRMYVATMEAKLNASDRERAKLHDEITELRRHYGISKSGPGDMNVVSRSLGELQKLRKENADLQEVIRTQTNRINGLVATGKRQSELLRSINKSNYEGEGPAGATRTIKEYQLLEEKLQEADAQYTKLKKEYGRLRGENDDLREKYESACTALESTEAGVAVVKTLNATAKRSSVERQRLNDTKLMSHRNRSSASPHHHSCSEPRSVIESPKRISAYGTMGPPTRTISRLTEHTVPVKASTNGDAAGFTAAFDTTLTKQASPMPDSVYKTAGTYQAIKNIQEKDKEIAQLKDELFNCYSADEVEKLHRVIELRETQLAEVTKERDDLRAYLERYNTAQYDAKKVADENDNLKKRIAARDEAIHKMTRELCTVARATRSSMENKLQEKDIEIINLNSKIAMMHDDYMRLKNESNAPRQNAVEIESREKYLRMVAESEQQNHIYRQLIQDQQAQINVLAARLTETEARAVAAEGLHASAAWPGLGDAPPSAGTQQPVAPFPQNPPGQDNLQTRLQDIEILKRELRSNRSGDGDERKTASERPRSPPGVSSDLRPASDRTASTARPW